MLTHTAIIPLEYCMARRAIELLTAITIGTGLVARTTTIIIDRTAITDRRPLRSVR